MPEHVITWRPGRTGKGWLFPDGTVRAWSVNQREEPHHNDVVHPDGSIRFRIAPDGSPEVFHGGRFPQAEGSVLAAIRDHLGVAEL